MITKLNLVDRAYLSPGLMAAAKQESYLLFHRPAPWCRIALKAAGAVILIAVCIRMVTS